MMPRANFRRNANRNEEASGHSARYSIFQPQFKRVPGPESTQGPYSTTPYDDPIRDVLADDERYHCGEAFDSFDQNLLLQTYEDRQRQAAQGRARLSLPAGQSRSFSNLTFSQPISFDDEEGVYDCRADQCPTKRSIYGQLNRFANSQNPPEEHSSDIQVESSSSPALRAGQRRIGNNAAAITLDRSIAYGLQDGAQQDVETTAPEFAYKRHQFMPPILDPGGDQEQLPILQERPGTQHSLEHPPPSKPSRKSNSLMHATPVVQGIKLIPITALPDRLRTIFPFPTFNAVQSKCFERVFRSNNNFLLASPTGSGKTAILELAICRTVAANASGQYKIVYQAPTKALCSERQRDWESKFNPIRLKCAELTGDSDAANLRNVQSANIIITTPEKWDSITRRWKDHEKLMSMITLFLIDEVHILKEDRGAVLETVVSRMKSIGTDVRFLALSATVPNFYDVAAWLGKNNAETHEPAMYENFGEEFRPVQLRKHVCGYVCNNSNDFAFERALDSKLPEVISKYSERKPIMIFCATRNSTVNTAKLITKWWSSHSEDTRPWDGLLNPLRVRNKDLYEIITSGVAFHHAGLDVDDRMLIERAFISGEVSVICCTSTLAVGVNLPCHLVIIKNTVAFTANGLQEYSDLEMMQMLGRAGRPQFEDSAVAVIMTRQSKVHRYERMVSGQELLESRLHLNLIDHVNAEIGLGTIRDLFSARKWLMGTFLYVRLQQNPDHYKFEGAQSGQNIEEQVDEICFRDITLLRMNNLISGQDYFRSTEFGQAMARYYVHFETMKVFMGIPPKSSPSEILSAIAQATEFSAVRFRQGEKSFYKTINKSPSIRWTIPVNLDLPAQKVSLIIQSILGSTDINWNGEMGKHRSQYIMEAQMIFKNISSLVRCIIDCQAFLGDSTGIHSALMLERSLGSQAWDDSPLQMKQIEDIGVVAVRKLVNAGIRSMDDLESCEAHRIETIIGRNPPFGIQVLERVKLFPKLHVSLHAEISSTIRVHDGVKIQVKVEIGFLNEKPPHRFGNKLVYICLLVETSDGRKAHFARISGSKLGYGQTLGMPVLLASPDQFINCYVMCDGIGGSMRSASLKPQIPSAMFPALEPAEPDIPHQSNMSKRRIEGSETKRKKSAASEDFGDDGIDDEELVQASHDHHEFDHIDNYDDPTKTIGRQQTTKKKLQKSKQYLDSFTELGTVGSATGCGKDEPVQLANGRWACNHRCKNRNSCKHLCCKEGVDKPPKKKLGAAGTAQTARETNQNLHGQSEQPGRKGRDTQTKLQLVKMKRTAPTSVEELDLTNQEKRRDLRNLDKLHKNVQRTALPSPLQSVANKKPAYCYSEGGLHNFSFIDQSGDVDRAPSEDDFYQYDEADHVHFSSQQNVLKNGVNHAPEQSHSRVHHQATTNAASQGSDTFSDDDSLLRDALVGLVDSQELQVTVQENLNDSNDFTHIPNFDDQASLQSDSSWMDIDVTQEPSKSIDPANNVANSSRNPSLQPSILENLPTVVSSKDPETQHGSKAREASIKALILGEVPQGSTMMSMKPGKPVPQISGKENDKRANNSGGLKNESLTKKRAETKAIPKAYEDLEPWIFQEFGDVVELVEE